MKRGLITGLLILFLAMGASAQMPSIMLPQGSVANADNSLATTINPAILGANQDMSIHLLIPYIGGDNGKNGTDYGVSIALPGLGYYGQGFGNNLTVPDSIDASTSTVGIGGGDHGFYCGTSYTWSNGLDRGNSWDVGMLYRPFNSLSVGAVARNVNNPKVYGVAQDVGWDFGLAFRPLGLVGPVGNKWSHRVTILADANMRRTSGTKYTDNMNYKFGAEVEVIPGVTGHFDYSPEVTKGVFIHDNTLWGGLTFNFGNVELGAYQRDAKNDAGSGVAWIGTSTHKKDSWLAPSPKQWVEIRLDENIVDYEQAGFSLFKSSGRQLRNLINDIDRMGEDPNVSGIVLKLEGFGTGFSKLGELRDALLEFKAKGKKIVAFMESAGNGGYYLATVADKIYFAPASDLGLVGFASEPMFLRGLFDLVGVRPELEHIGDYKSYSDMFTRSDMSQAQKEATEAILDDYYKIFVQAIADGRGMFNDDVKNLIDKGPFTSKQAKDAKLVDSLVFEDMIPDLVKSVDGGKKAPRIVSEMGYKMNNRKAKREWDDMRKKSIAIVYATGGITSGESSNGGLFGSESMGSKTMVRAIRKARENKDVAAIVLRVDSPGGSGLASEMILREIERTRTGDNRKPVIVSMSDVAGSGGYYIACTADTIVAMPGTITGSIGVVAGKFSWDPLQKKIGYNTATIKRGAHADSYTMNRAFTPEERDQLRAMINQFYIEFVQHVADGRGMDTAAVNKVGQGRIWSGVAGKENGLVDVLGGLKTAINLAATAGGIKPGEAYDVKTYPNAYEMDLEESFGEQAVARALRSSLPTKAVQMLDQISDETRWEDGEILYLMPYKVEVH